MGTLMQMLLEALRANAEERNDPALGGQEPDELSGFILENVQVATMPYIEYEDEKEVNPLVQFAHNKGEARGGGNPQNLRKLMDHLVRLEEKVKVLEKCVPPKKYSQRIWLAPGLSNPRDEDSSSYPEDDESEAEPEQLAKNGSGGSRPPGSGNRSGSAGRSGRRVTTNPPVRLEKEQRSCFARLLFSRCWTAKDDGAGWRVKRRCPTPGSLSCPCGNIGPCKNVKANACPVDQLASTKQKSKPNKKKTGATAVSEGATFAQKPSGRCKSASSKGSRNISKTNGKPLIGKLLPCCFRDHKHTECCCRCTDNPKLNVQKKSDKSQKLGKKSSVSKVPSKKSLHSASEMAEEDSDLLSDETEEYGDDDPQRVQAYNVRSFSDFSKLKRDYFGSSRKNADSRIPSKRRTGTKKSLNRVMKDPKSRKRPESPSSALANPVKSTTSFQITLHPILSEGELPETEVVRHQILKTLSTIHGPMKVEQKIVVQGSENSVVIVTHGEACQCKLCHILKGKLNHNESVEGSPQVVKISTKKGCDTLINHSDGCKCDLCGVLDPAVTNNPGSTTLKPRNETLVVATCSAANLDSPEVEASKPAPTLPTTGTNVTEDRPLDRQMNERTRTVKIHSFGKKSMCQANNASKKVKRCQCTKCRQRWRVERLKLRLKKEMGSEEYEKVVREITRRRNRHDRVPYADVKPSVQSDSEDGDYVAPKKTKKSVSFSDDPDSEYYPEDESRNLNVKGFCGREGKCVLCEELEINGENLDKTDKREDKNRSPLKNNDSTVYSVNASTEGSELVIYGSGLPEQDGIALMRKSKPLRKGSCHHLPDEQKCFPPKHVPGTPSKKRAPTEEILRKEISEELHATEKGAARVDSHHETGSSVQCRQEQDLREGLHVDQPGILLQDGAFPKKFVSWSPGSRSNMATAHSSESFYVPDEDEFPIVNMECEESIPSSGRNTDTVSLQRLQIPLWFRMLPDRSPH